MSVRSVWFYIIINRCRTSMELMQIKNHFKKINFFSLLAIKFSTGWQIVLILDAFDRWCIQDGPTLSWAATVLIQDISQVICF